MGMAHMTFSRIPSPGYRGGSGGDVGRRHGGAPPQLRAVARWRARPDGAELEEGCVRRKKTPTRGHVLALSHDWSYNSAAHF
jgi:hypothetical protein